MFKPLMTSVLLGTLVLGNAAQAPNEGSEILQSGVVSVMLSPLLSVQGKPVEASAALGAGSVLTVVGVGTVVGEASAVTVERASDGSRYVIKLSEKTLKELGVAVGSSVKTVAESTGYALIMSGKLVAFIPNEIGQALLGQTKI